MLLERLGWTYTPREMLQSLKASDALLTGRVWVGESAIILVNNRMALLRREGGGGNEQAIRDL